MKLTTVAAATAALAQLTGGNVYLAPEEVDLGQDCQHPRLRQAVLHYRGLSKDRGRIIEEKEGMIGELQKTIARLEGEVAACNRNITREKKESSSWEAHAELLKAALEASLPSVGLLTGALGVYFRPHLLRLLSRIAPRIPWHRLCGSAATTPTTIFGGGERLPAATSVSPIYRPPASTFYFPSPPSTLPPSAPSLPRATVTNL